MSHQNHTQDLRLLEGAYLKDMRMTCPFQRETLLPVPLFYDAGGFHLEAVYPLFYEACGFYLEAVYPLFYDVGGLWVPVVYANIYITVETFMCFMQILCRVVEQYKQYKKNTNLLVCGRFHFLLCAIKHTNNNVA